MSTSSTRVAPDPGRKATSLRAPGGCSAALFADDNLLIRRHPRHPTSRLQNAPFGTRLGDDLRIELPINPSETVELFPIPFAVALRARSGAALPPRPRPLARMNKNQRAGPALIQRSRKACAPHRHAAVGPDRRGHGGPDAVQPHRLTCVCVLGEDAESTKRFQLSDFVFPEALHIHFHPRRFARPCLLSPLVSRNTPALILSVDALYDGLGQHLPEPRASYEHERCVWVPQSRATH
jgi:hypothetical protein